MIKNIVNQFSKNFKSGLSVAIVSIPLSIPLAVASWATPLQGILTAIYAGLMASLFGWSKYNIVGPAGALSGILFLFALKRWAAFLPLLALVSWAIILLISVLRMTKYITLIPSTALHGFMMGVGITIAATQFNNALWLTGLPKHKEFLMNVRETIIHYPDIKIFSVVVFAIAFGLIILSKRYLKQLPAVIPVSTVGILFWYLNAHYFGLPLLKLGDQFPELSFLFFEAPQWLSSLKDYAFIKDLLMSGLVVALVALLETIISAKIADRAKKSHFNQEKEVFWLSLANLLSGLMGGLPASGVFVRTAVNFKSGATSSYSQLISSICILLISLFLFSSFSYLPLPVVAAILINVALWMIDIPLYKKIFSYNRGAFFILMIVGILCLIEDPMVGILVGTAISLLIYLKNSSDGHLYATVFRDGKFFGKMNLRNYCPHQKASDIVICKFSGEINFITISAEIDQLCKLQDKATVILSFSHITHIDLDGLETLEEICEYFDLHGIEYYFSGVDGELLSMFKKTHYYRTLHDQWRIWHSSSFILQKLGVN